MLDYICITTWEMFRSLDLTYVILLAPYLSWSA